VRDPLLRYLFLALLAEEASAEFVRQRSYEPGASIMPLEEWLAFREARGEELALAEGRGELRGWLSLLLPRRHSPSGGPLHPLWRDRVARDLEAKDPSGLCAPAQTHIALISLSVVVRARGLSQWLKPDRKRNL
jgi:hypothetical protein